MVASLDGDMSPMADSGSCREATAGTRSFHYTGERQHTIYLAAAPECGKQAFHQRIEREIVRAKQNYPDARYPGIAGGAVGISSLLEQHWDRQLTDFIHATEYVGKIRERSIRSAVSEYERAHWQHEHCHRLKHDPDALDSLISEAARLSRRSALSQPVRDGTCSAWTCFGMHRRQMCYRDFLAEARPIGSSVTEAACKTLINQWLCALGMRWKTQGANIALSLRGLTQAVGCWAQFWEQIAEFGAEC